MTKIEDLEMLNVITSIYFCSYVFDLDNNTFLEIKNDNNDKEINKKADSTCLIKYFFNKVIEKQSEKDMIEFLDLSTVKSRFKGQHYLSCEYKNKYLGWCRAFFFPIYNQDEIEKVIFCAQLINEQKTKELNQIDSLKLQTEIVNVLAENYYLLCFVDLVKSKFKFLTNTANLNEMLGYNIEQNIGFNDVIETFVSDEYKNAVKQFLDVTTIYERMANVNHLSMEYVDKFKGACQFDINIVSRNKLGYPSSIILTSRVLGKENINNIIDKEVLNSDAEKINELIFTDPLTGLLNRRAYDSITEKLKTKQSIGLVIVDVDYFKQVNDTSGHDVGDKVLIRCAELLKTVCRSTDYIFRFGGDEFVIILRNSTDIVRNAITKKIKSINEEINYSSKDNIPLVSISAGCAFSNEGFSEELFKHADESLYYVKNNGKKDIKFYDSKVKDNKIKPSNIANKSFYSKSIINFDKREDINVLSNERTIIDKLLLQNNAVGIVVLKNEAGYPIESLSEFVVVNLGFDYNSFVKASKYDFINLIHPDERELFNQAIINDEKEIKLRLITSSENYSWVNICFEKYIEKDNTSKIMMSLRIVNDSVLGDMCEKDYRIIGIIDCKHREITIKKNRYYDEEKVQFEKKYGYDKLLKSTVNSSVRNYEKEIAFRNNSIEYIKEKLSQNEIYENILPHIDKNNNIIVYRHKYRYLDKTRELILYTEENVTFWAEIDDITGLQNSRGFVRSVRLFLEKSENKNNYSIVLFDIDGFKVINNMLGQMNGNTCLKIISTSLKASNLKPIYIGRVFADRFACLVENGNLKAEYIKDIFEQTVVINNNSYKINLYCGIYNIQQDEKEYDIISMVDKAKLATTYIQNMGLKPYSVFNDSMNNDYIDYIEINGLLEKALLNNEFEVFYQPIFNTQSRKVVSAEALIRWNSKEKGAISPSKFIPILEKNGNISKLDLLVQKKVIEFQKERYNSKQIIVPISLNLSRLDFLDDDIIESILNINNNYFNHSMINYEITETSFYEIGLKGLQILEKLREKGSKILLDDFGTGFSSLSSMSNQNFDVIKLDKDFIKQIGENKKTEKIIVGTINLIHSLGSLVIAEGVETKEQYEFLLENSCDFIQGYLLSKPVSEEEFIKLLTNIGE